MANMMNPMNSTGIPTASMHTRPCASSASRYLWASWKMENYDNLLFTGYCMKMAAN